MAFKHRKTSYFYPSDVPEDKVLTFNNVDGVDVPTIITIPSIDVSKDVPSYEDYTLQALLNSGVPLNPVNTNIYNSDVDVEKEFDKVTSEFENNNTDPKTL